MSRRSPQGPVYSSPSKEVGVEMQPLSLGACEMADESP